MNMLVMREARGGWLGVHNAYGTCPRSRSTGWESFVQLWSCLRVVAEIQTHRIVAGSGVFCARPPGQPHAPCDAGHVPSVSYQYYFYYIAGLAIGARTIAGRGACAYRRSRHELSVAG